MSRRRIVQWTCASAACVALAFVFVLVRQGGRPRLPALTPYGNLPVQFNRALQSARSGADSGGRGADGVRELAHLYQANRLFQEALSCYRVVAASPDGLSARDH